MNFTFGIITDGKSDTNLNLIIHSIKNQNITNYEIIIVGNTSLIYDEIKVIKFDDSHHKPWITRKKNLITQNAKYENIVFMHDYIRLDDNWYSGWENFGDFKCATNKIINLDDKLDRVIEVFNDYDDILNMDSDYLEQLFNDYGVKYKI